MSEAEGLVDIEAQVIGWIVWIDALRASWRVFSV